MTLQPAIVAAKQRQVQTLTQQNKGIRARQRSNKMQHYDWNMQHYIFILGSMHGNA